MLSRIIHAENYCSYQTLHVEFDKLGRIFSLSGPNGAGKTSLPKLIPVIRYAEAPREGQGIAKFVYGVSSYGDPAIIEKMKKAKEFPILKAWEVLEHGQYLYRIIRTYNPNLSKSNHTLELQRKDSGGSLEDWTAESGAASIGGSIAETQEMINTLFGPYRAYISSTFMNDGASGLLDTPDDFRDEVANFLLNIGDYEGQGKAVGEKRLLTEKGIELQIQQLQDLSGKVTLKEQSETDVVNLGGNIMLIENKISELNNRAQVIQLEKDVILKDITRAEEASRSVNEISQRIAKLDLQARELRDLIENHDVVRENAAKLKVARETIQDQQQRYMKIKDYEVNINKLTQTIQGESKRISATMDQLQAKITAADKASRQIWEENVKIEQINKSVTEIGDSSADIASAQSAVEDILTKYSSTSSKQQQKAQRMEELRENILAISKASGCLLLNNKDVVCPVLTNTENRKQVLDKFTAEGVALKDEVLALNTTLAGYAQQKQTLSDRIKALQATDRRQQELATDKARAEQAIKQLQATVDEIDVLKDQISTLQLQLAEESYCDAEREQVKQLQEESGQIGYDQVVYNVALQTERDNAKFETASLRLDKAETDLENIEKNIQQEETNKAEKETQITGLETIREQFDKKQEEFKTLNWDVRKLQEEMQTTKSQQIAAQNTLNAALDAEKQIEAINAQVADKRKDIVALRVLEAAYKPQGIPLMKYELCLPALEDKINGALSVLSPGWELRISAKINNRGKFVIPIETQNPHGVVLPYLARSKGERRIIALSTFVGIGLFWADRTGAQPQQMFVDETEDGLDEDNMQKFKNTIAAMSTHFGQIGIVSHRPELQSLAQTQLVVYRDAHKGSYYEVSGTHDRPPRVRVGLDMEADQAAAFETGISIIQEETGASRGTAAEMAAISTAQGVAGTKKKIKRKVLK